MRIGILFLLLSLVQSAWAERHEGLAYMEDVNYYTSILFPPISQKDFQNLWKTWSKADRKKFKKLSSEEKQRAIYERYGFVRSPRPDAKFPYGFSETPKGKASTNCLLCHSGVVLGEFVPGIGNANLDLQSFTEDYFALKFKSKTLTRILYKNMSYTPFARYLVPDRTVRGLQINISLAWFLFGQAESDMTPKLIPTLYGLKEAVLSDAPAWWGVPFKERIYWDAIAPNVPKGYLTTPITQAETKEDVYASLPKHEKIEEYFATLKSPKFPGRVDQARADLGEMIFEDSCAKCHGTYPLTAETYPNAVREVGTDSHRRIYGATQKAREWWSESWLGDYGVNPMSKEDPEGYLAPALTGVWATAPYFHNGSVPTLKEVLFADERPLAWKRTGDPQVDYDLKNVGLQVERFSEVPKTRTLYEERQLYDTTQKGMGNEGHSQMFESLSGEDRLDLLEYLKSL